MHANTREEIDKVYSGDIAAAVGLKDTNTGDTLCDENNPVILESMEFPEPVISLAIEPKSKDSQEKIGCCTSKTCKRRSNLQNLYKQRNRTNYNNQVWANCILNHSR